MREGIIATALVAVLGLVMWIATGEGSKADHPIPGIDKEALFVEYTTTLKKAKSCEERKEAVKKLELLRDTRAIKPIKRARDRTRGSTFGFGGKRVNRCLKKEANKAIKTLRAIKKSKNSKNSKR